MLSRFLILLVLFCLCFIVQESGVLMAWGVLPNLILILFLFVICRGERPAVIGALLFVSVVVAYVRTPFWAGEALAFAGVVAVCAFCYRWLTGNDLFDYAILLLSGSAVLEFLTTLVSSAPFRFVPFFVAVGYTVVLGMVLWFVVPASLRVAKPGTDF